MPASYGKQLQDAIREFLPSSFFFALAGAGGRTVDAAAPDLDRLVDGLG